MYEYSYLLYCTLYVYTTNTFDDFLLSGDAGSTPSTFLLHLTRPAGVFEPSHINQLLEKGELVSGNPPKGSILVENDEETSEGFH